MGFSVFTTMPKGNTMFEVRIFENEAPCLVTDSEEEALAYWMQNRRKVVGQVGVFDVQRRFWIA
jgi:hypothetical protein